MTQVLDPTSLRVYPTNAFTEFQRDEVEQSIVARFEKQVVLHRERVAVKTAQHELNYDELNRLANRLAHAIARNSEPQPRGVALLLDHDAPLIASIIAVLKAGRFYVALEPSHPAERLRQIVEDSGADLLITEAEFSTQAEAVATPGCGLLRLDVLEPGLPEENIDRTASPDALAYLIYTSGSTGQPKGVCQTQRNVLHHIRKYTNACHLCADDRFSLLARCSFGASVSNLFGALLNGAALFPFKVNQAPAERFLAWLREERITICHSVPLVFRNLAHTLSAGVNFPDLRLIKLGGEPITRSDVELFRRHFARHALLYVGLGASEMNCIRCWLLDGETDFEGPIAPVGYAVEDTEVLLLDEKQREVAAGENGEIAISSPYLFPGYWRSEKLTAAAFVPDPRGHGGRVFRTGDIGRMLPGGLLQHLGRNEFQIKVRGAHIDAAEIEGALRAEPEIRDCAVVALGGPEEKQLIACLVSGNGRQPDTATLRSRLSARLPEYMVPARFMWLEALPTTNGKIDRRALRELAGTAPKAEGGYVAPRTALERQLAEIWARVFGRERVGVRDNFFELGGHSLHAGRLAVEIEKLLGAKVPFSTVFWAPTIEALARHLTTGESSSPPSSLVELQPEGSELPLFIIHGWGGDVHFYGELARLLPEQPVYGLQAVGLDGNAPRHIRVEDMAAHYLDEIRTVQPHGPYHFIGFSLGSLIAFEMARQAYERGEQVEFVGLLDPPPRPAPWLAYTRTVAPLLAQSARYHLTRWLRTGESFHFKRRMKRLRRWIDRNQTRPVAVIEPPECSSTPPEIPGFKDYYKAVSFPYRLRRYPGTIDLIIGDNAPSGALLPLWGHVAEGGARYHRISCMHKEMIQREFLPAVAATLQTALSQRRKSTASA